MPSLRVHKAISKKRTGLDFEELHKWIDKSSKDKGINHRTERHSYNTTEEKQIKDYWNAKEEGLGEKAVVEWLFHIALDNLETAFKRAKQGYRTNNIYNFFKFGLLPDSKYIYFYFDKMSKEELENEFDEYFIEED
jgi:hypothetical protein